MLKWDIKLDCVRYKVTSAVNITFTVCREINRCHLLGWYLFTDAKRSGVAQRVGRDIALLFHDCGTRRGWVVSSTPRPHSTPRKEPVPIVQEAGWAPGTVWTGGKSRSHRDSISYRPTRSQSLYQLSYPAHIYWSKCCNFPLDQLLIKLYCICGWQSH
jgi:hypothetical protein